MRSRPRSRNAGLSAREVTITYGIGGTPGWGAPWSCTRSAAEPGGWSPPSISAAGIGLATAKDGRARTTDSRRADSGTRRMRRPPFRDGVTLLGVTRGCDGSSRGGAGVSSGRRVGRTNEAKSPPRIGQAKCPGRAADLPRLLPDDGRLADDTPAALADPHQVDAGREPDSLAHHQRV